MFENKKIANLRNKVVARFQKIKKLLLSITKTAHLVWEWFLRTYRITAFFIKSRVWPSVKRILAGLAILTFLGLITIFTKNGLKLELTGAYNELLSVLASTIGTIVAIFFSLVLIPLNQIASKYSPKFLKYMRRDVFLITAFVYSVAALAYDVIFLLVGASKPVAIAAVIGFGGLLLVLGLSVLHIIKFSNPYYSILMPAHKEIVKTFRKLIPRYKKACVKMTKKTFKGQEDLTKSVDICLFRIDEKITNYIQESLLPIREITIKSIKDFDLEQAKNAVQTMMSVILHYLYARREYYSDDDPLLYFLYTEYKLIALAANNELKLRLHEFITDCWRQVGVQAAVVNVKGMKRLGENFNSLVIYPVTGLKELCALNLLEMDSYAPGKACDALADIGVQLMREGYDNQAASIVEELEIISKVAEQNGVKNVSGSADYAIMRIYTAGVIFRSSGSKDPYNLPYRGINKSIDNLLGTFLKTKRTVYDNMILSPFIGNFMDPFKGLYLSRISEYGIFSQSLDKFSLEMNLECVRANLRSIKAALKLLAPQKDWYFSDQAIENLYRIILNLLSYINRDMAKDHIMFYKNHPFIDKDLANNATEIIIEGLSILCEFIKSRADNYIFENDHIHVLFSLYFIILYEYKFRPNESLKELFDRVHELLRNLLTEYKALPDSDSNDDLYKYYRLLIEVLNQNDFKAVALDFNVPAFEYRSRNVFASSHESQYPKTMFDGQWIIKRPGFQVNGYYYNDIESKFKLDALKFY